MVEKPAAFRQRRAKEGAGASGSIAGRYRSTSRSPEPSKTSVRAPGGPRRRRLALGQPLVQFRWLVVLAVSSERCLDARSGPCGPLSPATGGIRIHAGSLVAWYRWRMTVTI